jgi:hypothetical protein
MAETAAAMDRRAMMLKSGRGMAQGVINVGLTIWTVRDIRRRGDDEIKGNRKFWLLAAFAPPIGPLAYLIFGRRRSGDRTGRGDD